MSVLRVSLPNPPRKRKAVATAMAREIRINVVKAKNRSVENGIDENTINMIIDFYQKGWC